LSFILEEINIKVVSDAMLRMSQQGKEKWIIFNKLMVVKRVHKVLVLARYLKINIWCSSYSESIIKEDEKEKVDAQVVTKFSYISVISFNVNLLQRCMT